MKTVMIIHSRELINHISLEGHQQLRRLYGRMAQPMPAIDGIKWFYPSVEIAIMDESHWSTPLTMRIYCLKPTAVPIRLKEVEPPRKRNNKPDQPRFRPKDHYGSRR